MFDLEGMTQRINCSYFFAGYVHLWIFCCIFQMFLLAGENGVEQISEDVLGKANASEYALSNSVLS